jgi:endonuclease YncB( thermonuclease family)
MRHSPSFPRRIVLTPGALQRRPLTRRRIVTLIALFAVTGMTALFEERLSGAPRALDGGSLTIGDERIRLYAIDAPEIGQPCKSGGDCGMKAKEFLGALIHGRTVDCSRRADEDRNGRIIAQCSADGIDVGREMVRTGHAMAFPSVATVYVADEPRTFDFDRPSDWRKLQPEQPERRHGHR